MSMQDPISDMLTRIRNAQQRSTVVVTMPASKVKTAIAKVLQSEGYINGWENIFSGGHPAISIKLKYHNERPVIANIQRVSKPSLRVYMSTDDLMKLDKTRGVQNGLGIAVVSTSEGVMTHQAAIKKGKGGEVLCYVN
jgi:small subunit ribosomal protein S8